MKKSVTTLKQTVVIPAAPKEVYEAYVNPAKHSEFTGAKAKGKPVVGGKYSSWDGYIFGKYIELEVGKRVVQEWTTTDWSEGYDASRLELTFKAVPAGTEIDMVHSRVPDEMADELCEGWVEFYWNPLKEYFSKESKA